MYSFQVCEGFNRVAGAPLLSGGHLHPCDALCRQSPSLSESSSQGGRERVCSCRSAGFSLPLSSLCLFLGISGVFFALWRSHHVSQSLSRVQCSACEIKKRVVSEAFDQFSNNEKSMLAFFFAFHSLIMRLSMLTSNWPNIGSSSVGNLKVLRSHFDFACSFPTDQDSDTENTYVAIRKSFTSAFISRVAFLSGGSTYQTILDQKKVKEQQVFLRKLTSRSIFTLRPVFFKNLQSACYTTNVYLPRSNTCEAFWG